MRLRDQRSLEKALDSELHSNISDSEYREHSQKSQDERETDNGEAKVSFGDRDGPCLVMISEFRELSPNSRVVR